MLAFLCGKTEPMRVPSVSAWLPLLRNASGYVDDLRHHAADHVDFVVTVQQPAPGR